MYMLLFYMKLYSYSCNPSIKRFFWMRNLPSCAMEPFTYAIFYVYWKKLILCCHYYKWCGIQVALHFYNDIYIYNVIWILVICRIIHVVIAIFCLGHRVLTGIFWRQVRCSSMVGCVFCFVWCAQCAYILPTVRIISHQITFLQCHGLGKRMPSTAGEV